MCLHRPFLTSVPTMIAVRRHLQGLMHKRREPCSTGGPNCFQCTVSVDDVDAVAEAVVAHGGRITMSKSPIPTVGEVIYFDDAEGNIIGAMKYENRPHT